MRSPACFAGGCMIALALASGCGRGQQTGTTGNPSTKALLNELAEALEEYERIGLSPGAPGDGYEEVEGQTPAVIRAGMRTRLNLLEQQTGNRADVQELLKPMSESLDALEKFSQGATPDVAQMRQELEKLKAQVQSLRNKL